MPLGTNAEVIPVGTLVGEVQEHRDGHWRTVHLGQTVRVTDRRRVKPDGPYGWTRAQQTLWIDLIRTASQA